MTNHPRSQRDDPMKLVADHHEGKPKITKLPKRPQCTDSAAHGISSKIARAYD